MEYIIYATGIMAFLIIYIAFKLSNTPEDRVFRFFLILLVMGLFFLMAKGTLDNQTRCFPVINQTIEKNSTNTELTYMRFCYDEDPQTPLILYKWVIGIIIAFSAICIVYLSYWFFKYMKDELLPKRFGK